MKQRKEEFAKLLKKKCPYHPDSKHSMEDCYLLWDTFRSSDSKGKKKSDGDHGDRKGDEGFPDSIQTINVIFGGPAAPQSSRSCKQAKREVFAAEPTVPTLLKWSDTPITFSR